MRKAREQDSHHVNKWTKFRLFMIIFIAFTAVTFEIIYAYHSGKLKSDVQDVELEIDEYGGWVNYPTELGTPTATGFFSVQKLNDRWWIVDPIGNPYILKGMCCVTYTNYTLTADPDDFSRKNMYSSKSDWAKDASELLKTWGFNNLGEWSDGILHSPIHNLSYFHAVSVTGCMDVYNEDITGTNTADYFDPLFNATTKDYIRNQVEPHKDNPLLIGWFCDGELFWGQDWRSEETLIQNYFMKEIDAPGRIYLLNWLGNRTGTIENFNEIWGTEIGAWSEITNLDYDDFTPENDMAQLVSDEWAQLCVERYHNVSTHWIRKYDSNHLVFGTRYADLPSNHILNGTSKFVDAIAHSGYRWEPRIDRMDEIMPKLDCPMIFHEFAWKSMESLQANSLSAGAPVTFTEAQRSLGYYYFVEKFMRRPYALGFAYFSWRNWEAEWFLDGEGIGFLTYSGIPYYKYAAMASNVNKMLEFWHMEGGTEVAIKVFPTSGYVYIGAAIFAAFFNVGNQWFWNVHGDQISQKFHKYKIESRKGKTLFKIVKTIFFVVFDFCLLVAFFVPIFFYFWLGPLEPKSLFLNLF